MEVVSLNNGSNIVIGSMYDAAEIVASKVSYELAEYIKRILWNQDDLDKYISGLEEENRKFNHMIQEYTDKNLWNEEYFKYLIDIGEDEEKL